MGYEYDGAFFDFVNASSSRSARLFLDRLIESTLAGAAPRTLLDVGCGRGAWLAEWLRKANVAVTGVDGHYVDPRSLLIPAERFVAADISQPLDLGRRFDLVECLEVAEHLPGSCADTLVDSLVRHGDLILFSAAIPGQGGEFHVNEQPYDYWRAKFATRGYETYDAIRPLVAGLDDIEPWYRYNSFVFANDAGRSRLSEAARARHVPAGVPAADLSPFSWRLRCAMLSLLPAETSSQLARLKHRMANQWQKVSARR
jgi:SAM-dependent methyltransferase